MEKILISDFISVCYEWKLNIISSEFKERTIKKKQQQKKNVVVYFINICKNGHEIVRFG